jgi:predicted type IV restriction endonuclease
MSKTFEEGKDEVARLCKYFRTNRDELRAPGAKEAHIRQLLIDPFFEALGWDVRNSSMTAPQYREVIPEDSLDVEGQQKAPDYTFRFGSLPKFYVEAKKCGVNIGADRGPAYQLRRYGWSAKLALSILTDFEELSVYDCTKRPRENDKATEARIEYFKFEEYPDRWQYIWDTYSREAVRTGAFDQYAASKRKRGTSEVDVEFLKEIEGWRDALARNMALRNKDLSSDDLNAAVQLTIDRVVFLRMAEDRGLESQDRLLRLCEQPEIYTRFISDLCRKADKKYNSGLFHFQKEEGISEAPDRITPKLEVDDKVFKPILQSLYFAHGSPYHFGVMPVEILGTVYERFLGKVIRLTAGHQAKVEEKPEVRKAGGVYYTPAYIVEYIVQQTLGKQIEGRSPAELAGTKNKPPLRVLDMACGSGSFLLGAYRCLLDYCLKWYIDHEPETFTKAVYKDPHTHLWRLTIEEKKRILTAHIFGVDIDHQAVEVSKLSLLLKVLEGENAETVGQQRELFQERALPNLSDNIKCGNSLIGPGYFTGKLIPEPEDMKRVNPFDWKQGFPEAMQAGGFDCIIGNPPYIRIQTMKEWAPLEVEIYKEIYQSAQSGSYDIYVVFIEKGLKPRQSHLILSHY